MQSSVSSLGGSDTWCTGDRIILCRAATQASGLWSVCTYAYTCRGRCGLWSRCGLFPSVRLVPRRTLRSNEPLTRFVGSGESGMVFMCTVDRVDDPLARIELSGDHPSLRIGRQRSDWPVAKLKNVWLAGKLAGCTIAAPVIASQIPFSSAPIFLPIMAV